MRDDRKLEVWQLARTFAVTCCEATKDFPQREVYELAAQVRRGSASNAAHVAYGAGRDSEDELLTFLRISLGSPNEAEALPTIAADLGPLGQADRFDLESRSRDSECASGTSAQDSRRSNSQHLRDSRPSTPHASTATHSNR